MVFCADGHDIPGLMLGVTEPSTGEPNYIKELALTQKRSGESPAR